MTILSFNPAEAEEGFRRHFIIQFNYYALVSIQPKPKKGLEGRCFKKYGNGKTVSIQPKPKKGLEAKTFKLLAQTYGGVSIQPKPKKGLEVKTYVNGVVIRDKFQSSRSRRRV